MGTVIRLALLGPVRAWRDGIELDIGSPQQRALLALFALRGGESMTWEQLSDALWADEAPPSAATTIRTYVYKLRRVLGAEVLASSPGGYSLAAGSVNVDLAWFCRLVEEARALRDEGNLEQAGLRLDGAKSLWRGTALAGAHGHYVAAKRRWLEELRLGALEERFSAALELDEHAVLLAELAEAVAAHPLRERMRESLMLALYRAGRQAEALGAYQELRLLLRDELGIDPGTQLQSLYQRILRADPALLGCRVH
ncbi:MAG: BTAD domain-containing putative transcriptional regulator [Trebonia sp.]